MGELRGGVGREGEHCRTEKYGKVRGEGERSYPAGEQREKPIAGELRG